MKWAYKNSDNSFAEHNGLPQVWENISNFFALESNKEYLRTLGWYPLIDDTLPVQDSTREYYGLPTYRIDENFIVRKKCDIFQYQGLPSPEQIQEQKREEFFRDLRNHRNGLLRDSDWTQLADIQETKSLEWLNSWVVYRQELRDLPELYVDDQTFDIHQISWPIPPGV